MFDQENFLVPFIRCGNNFFGCHRQPRFILTEAKMTVGYKLVLFTISLLL